MHLLYVLVLPKIFLLFFLYGSSICAFGSTDSGARSSLRQFDVDDLSEDLLRKILSYLDTESASQFALSNKKNATITQSFYPLAVQLQNGRWRSVGKFISDNEITDIEDLASFITKYRYLLKNNQLRKDLINRIFADTSAMMGSEKPMRERLADLKCYHKSLSTALLPGLYAGSASTGAGLRALVEFYVWSGIANEVRDQIWGELPLEIANGIFNQPLLQVYEKIREQTGRTQIEAMKGEIFDQIDHQHGDKNREIICYLINQGIQINLKTPLEGVKEKIHVNLSRFFASSIRELDFSQDPVSDDFNDNFTDMLQYTLTLYQLSSLVLRYNQKFTDIEGIVAHISHTTRCTVAEQPYSGESDFIKTQLALFASFVPQL